MDRPRSTARPSVGRVCVALLQLPWERASLSHTSPPPSVRRSDRSGTLGARPMHRVGPRHLSTLPPSLVLRRREGGRARAAARSACDWQPATAPRRTVCPGDRPGTRTGGRSDGVRPHRDDEGGEGQRKNGRWDDGEERMGTQAAIAQVRSRWMLRPTAATGRCPPPDIKGGLFAARLGIKVGLVENQGDGRRENMAFALTAPPFTA